MKVSDRKNRIGVGSFNFIKGLTMLLIILGHMVPRYHIESILPLQLLFLMAYPFRNGLNRMFFIVAGYTFKETDIKPMLKKTFYYLVKPFILVGIIVTFLSPVIHYLNFKHMPSAINVGFRYFLTFLFGMPVSGRTVFGYELYDCSVVWFLLAVFLATNMLNMILKIQKEIIRLLAVILIFCSGFVFYKLDFTYFCIQQGLTAIVYYYWGYLLKRYQLLDESKRTRYCFAIMLTITIIYSVYGDEKLIYTNIIYRLIDYIVALFSGTVLMLIGLWINNIDFILIDKIKNIGMYTYWIMCIHSIEMICIPWYRLTDAMAEHQALAFLVEISVKTVIFVVSLTIIKRISVQRAKKKIIKLT